MAVDYKTYSGWSSGMQKRYRERYGSAPQQPFTPFQLPTSPPQGSYDPALDAQQRAETRGYGDLQASDATNSLYAGQDYQTAVARQGQTYAEQLQDIATGRTRSNEDFTTGSGRVNEDYTRGSTRSNEDYTTGTTRSNEDYGTATGNLVRAFKQLGQSQRGSINAAGLGGGALRQALSARTERQGIEQKALDTTHDRSLQDLSTGHTRTLQDLTTGKTRSLQDLGTAHDRSLQDYSTGETRAGEANTNTLADYLTNYTRGQAGQATQEAIAGRELGFSTQDLNNEKTYAAQAAGWDPTALRPANEYTRNGVTYRKTGNRRVLPSGQTVSLAQLRKLYQR